MEIYKATNRINGKAYIGLTENIRTRRVTHLYEVENGCDYYFHRAMRKHGADVFDWEIIATCNTREEAGDLETKLIKQHDTYHNGYNSTTGGENGYKMSKETRKKMSIAHTGIAKGATSEATKKKIAASLTGYKHTNEFKIQKSITNAGKNNPNYGNTWTNEQKENLSAKRSVPWSEARRAAYEKRWNKK